MTSLTAPEAPRSPNLVQLMERLEHLALHRPFVVLHIERYVTAIWIADRRRRLADRLARLTPQDLDLIDDLIAELDKHGSDDPLPPDPAA